MWQYIIEIVAIICGSIIVIDKHHSRNNPEINDLNSRINKLEGEIDALRDQFKN